MKDTKRRSRGQLAGQLWEAYAAGLFASPGQRVGLAPATQKGYDLKVKGERDAWSVSCKSLQRSKAEERFRAHATATYRLLLASLPPGSPISIHVRATGALPRAGLDLLAGEVVANALLLAGRQGGGWVRLDAAEVLAEPLEAAEGCVFGKPGGPRSVQFTYVSPRDPCEQDRFNRVAEKACKNLQKHTAAGEVTNTVCIRVREHVSMAAASNWACEFFGQNPFPAVASLLVVRPVVRWRTRGALLYSYFIDYEATAIANPRFEGRRSGEPLALSAFLGRSGRGESLVTLTASHGHYSTEGHYLFADGRVRYSELPLPEGAHPLSVPLLPHQRVIREEQIPGGPLLALGSKTGTDLLGTRERPFPFELSVF